MPMAGCVATRTAFPRTLKQWHVFEAKNLSSRATQPTDERPNTKPPSVDEGVALIDGLGGLRPTLQSVFRLHGVLDPVVDFRKDAVGVRVVDCVVVLDDIFLSGGKISVLAEASRQHVQCEIF